MQTNRSIFSEIEKSDKQYEQVEGIQEKAELLNKYFKEALDLENPVSPMDLLDEFELIFEHVEQLSASFLKQSNQLVKLSNKKMQIFEDIIYQIGPSMVELHNRLFPNPDLKDRHHVLKTASNFTKYDSLENRHFILEIKQIHDKVYKKTIKRDRF